MLIVIRLGSQLPIPGVDRFYFAIFHRTPGSAFNFFNAFTGGFFEADVNICIEYYPIHYVIHHYATFYDCDSKTGRDAEGRGRWKEKTDSYHSYPTVGLALLESIAMVIGFGRQGTYSGI